MKYNLTKPCDECPYLKDSGFTYASLAQHARGEFPCHKACDVNEDEERGGSFFEPKKNGKTPHCAGALIFLEKQGTSHQMMRIMERIGRYDHSKLDMTANVGSKPRDYRRETPSEKMRREMDTTKKRPRQQRAQQARKSRKSRNGRRAGR